MLNLFGQIFFAFTNYSKPLLFFLCIAKNINKILFKFKISKMNLIRPINLED